MTISNYTSFKDNYVHLHYGADIAALNTDNMLSLADVDMSSQDAKSSIYLN